MKILQFIEEWKKNIALIAFLLFITLILIYLFFNVIALFSRHSKSFNDMVKTREEYNRFMISQKELPSNKLINEYQEYVGELEKIYDGIQKAFSHKRQTRVGLSALEYKEQLFVRQKEFQEKSQAKGVSMPVDLGFKEFMGDRIPQDNVLPLLSLQLDLISLFMDCFLESGIDRVDNIVKRDFAKDQKYKSKLMFSFNFKTEMGGLIKFLDLIQSKKDVFIVENININTIPLDKFRMDNKLGFLLEISLDVSYIEL